MVFIAKYDDPSQKKCGNTSYRPLFHLRLMNGRPEVERIVTQPAKLNQ